MDHTKYVPQCRRRRIRCVNHPPVRLVLLVVLSVRLLLSLDMEYVSLSSEFCSGLVEQVLGFLWILLR